MKLAVLTVKIMHVIGTDQRYAGLSRDLAQAVVYTALIGQMMVLHLKVEIAAPKYRVKLDRML